MLRMLGDCHRWSFRRSLVQEDWKPGSAVSTAINRLQLEWR